MPDLSTWGADALAAIDLGSNSFRLEIARLRGRSYRSLAYWKEPIRLGAGLDADGCLTETAMQRALECLQRFGNELRGFSPEHVRAVATQTLREARNRDAFLARAHGALGYPVEVIAGREEARLIYSGVSRLQPSDATQLVVDIGGRSTELILGQHAQPLRTESFAVGSVGLSLRCFPTGELSAAAFREAQVVAAAELEEALAQFAKGRCEPSWTEVLGSSGTVGAVAQVVQAAGLSTDGSIEAAGLRWCIDACVRAGHVSHLQLPGLKDDRRNVVAGGLCILYTLVSLFGIERIHPAKGALRQGLVFDLAERLKLHEHQHSEDLREPTVLAAQQRFGIDRAQAGRVRGLAHQLFAHLQPKAEVEQQLELGWTAAWHELGQAVSHHDHHRHSHYLIAHLDAPGFSQDQLRRMAQLALGQRGGLRKVEDWVRGDADFIWQLLALRLAVLACHGRETVGIEHLSVQRRGYAVRLRVSSSWATQHPQGLYLLGQEALAWGKLGLVELSIEV